MAPKRPCPTPRCPNLQPCDAHVRVPFRNARRSSMLYSTGRWKREARSFLAMNPCCATCGKSSTIVDHRTPHRGDVGLFWAQVNWQSLCRRCHNAKTGRETRARAG